MPLQPVELLLISAVEARISCTVSPGTGYAIWHDRYDTPEPQVSSFDQGDQHNGREGLLVVSCLPRRCVIAKRWFFHARVIERAVSQVKAFASLYGPYWGPSAWSASCRGASGGGAVFGMEASVASVFWANRPWSCTMQARIRRCFFLWRRFGKRSSRVRQRPPSAHAAVGPALSVLPSCLAFCMCWSCWRTGSDPGWRNLAFMARRHGASAPVRSLRHQGPHGDRRDTNALAELCRRHGSCVPASNVRDACE